MVDVVDQQAGDGLHAADAQVRPLAHLADQVGADRRLQGVLLVPDLAAEVCRQEQVDLGHPGHPAPEKVVAEVAEQVGRED